ncbi:ubiquinone biosynthesis O-methyltransferase [Microcystis aeruginosa Sj]|uniref:Ubiquinone biosynthesis O-methyltransferase n=1 Tax=Microcystis aeruginosa Sj TaxID=1979544 RepID=A0A2Z6V368_MICAE|nr:class I SAM-dependent methyltransferase [Microcystis aeruginosa]MDB9414012.1 class I SAM-dependent methyltransferase [Microcystis aeruginosa CS-567/02]GBL12548.1 ubiquinone biosynthesis O-methyltransferase [Microcystis aeruginosa Sj]
MTEQMNQESVYCPLSGSSKIVLVEKIAISDLVSLYKKVLNCDVASEFGNIQEIDFYHSLESELYFFSPMITGSENFYEKLQVFDWYYLEEKNEYDYASKFIKPSDCVLEIGCGKGAFARKIHCQDYIGLEFSQKARDLAEKDGITVLNESIQDHALNNKQKYSVVCAFQVLEHISDIYTFIEASIECLKPGGILIYSVPSYDSFSKYVSNFFLDMPPHHVTRWTDTSLKNITKYFPIENLEIWHEPLQEVHKSFYATTIVKLALFKFLGKDIRNIDFGITYKILDIVSRIIGKIFAKGLISSELFPRGISVVSIYRKI